MKPEARRELDRMLRRERLKRLVPAVALGVLVLGIFAYVFIPCEVESREEIAGTVISWSRPQTNVGAGFPVITVRLEDGTTVVAESRNNAAPNAGDEIKLQMTRYDSSRVSYLSSK